MEGPPIDLSLIGFLRFNEWPERNSAKHEELARLEEMRRFGGKSGGDKGLLESFDRGRGESMFVLERFRPVRSLATPWEVQAEANAAVPPILVLDLNGHFAVAAMVGEHRGFAPGGLEQAPALAIFNTTDGAYLSGSAALCVSQAFDLYHHESEDLGPSDEVGEGDEPAVAALPDAGTLQPEPVAPPVPPSSAECGL
mmetsp:Transcript_32098/g.93190  ORF Transcript_32098/g.93190 Transcript_32098/m.93190 type:complete len:197 (+) Transcript_32098:650-1240(+)